MIGKQRPGQSTRITTRVALQEGLTPLRLAPISGRRTVRSGALVLSAMMAGGCEVALTF